jgi:ER lumen protein retaining receptor
VLKASRTRDRHLTSLTPGLAGISLLTQAMYALVFVTRYLDLVDRFISMYNSVFKAVYIISAFYVLFLMRWIYPSTSESRMAWQATGIVLAFSVLISLIFNYHFTLREVRTRL